MQNQSPPITIRPAAANDWPWIADTLMQTRARRRDSAIPYPTWKYHERMLAELHLEPEYGDSQCIVAHVEGDTDHFVGWLGWSERLGCIHYAYVKAALRRHGVATALVRATGLVGNAAVPCSHWGDFAATIPGAQYNPYLWSMESLCLPSPCLSGASAWPTRSS